MRRATDPWESHLGGIMNTLVPEPTIPSHQGPDARHVDPELDVVTIAIKVPETLAHLHSWYVELTRPATKEEVLDAFAASPRILLIDGDSGLSALNSVKEAMAMEGRAFGRPGRTWRRRSTPCPPVTPSTCRRTCSPRSPTRAARIGPRASRA